MEKLREAFLDSSQQRGTNDNWKFFTKSLHEIIEQQVTKKTVSSRHNLPYITKKIKRMTRVRKRRWDKAKKSKKAAHKREYEEIQDQIVKEMEMEFNYLEKLFDPADSRNKMNLFSFIKSKGRDQIGTPPLQHNNRLMTSAEDRAEALPKHYHTNMNQYSQKRILPTSQIKVTPPSQLWNI